ERSYVIEVDGYSRIKGMIGHGDKVKSAPFSVGGYVYDWVLWFYPNGSDITHYEAGYVSVFLALDSGFATDVRAKFRITLLDKNGEPDITRSKTNPERIFSSKGSCKGFSDFVGRAYLENPRTLSNDSVSIMCHVTVVKNIHKGDRLIVVPSRNLHQHLGDLLKSMDGADVTFHVGGESFSAHRVVLAARSSVFRAELFGGMKEKAGGPIEISDMESDVFKALLHFIYTDEYEPVPEMTDGCEARRKAVMAGHLLVAAERYNIERLKLICEERMCNLINPDIVATSLALAEQHGFHTFKDACFEFLASPSNPEAMMASDGYEHLKNSCPSVLKELAASFLPAELKAAKDIIMTI
uniref:BTB domain-containing protein n=2 Tax=Aegilops tauschii TaxID=37682 RepID=A0A452XUZ7_AEGTS